MSWLSKGLGKIKKVIDKTDPTGISGDIATGGLVKGGIGRSLIDKAIGKSKSGSSSSTAATKSTRYKRRERNPWKSKRQKAFEKKQGKSKRMISAGIRGAIKGVKKFRGKKKNDKLKKVATTSMRGFF